MVYKVKKRIKGRLYLYEQRSWREGGKVKTFSRYLGPVGAGEGNTREAARPAHCEGYHYGTHRGREA